MSRARPATKPGYLVKWIKCPGCKKKFKPMRREQVTCSMKCKGLLSRGKRPVSYMGHKPWSGQKSLCVQCWKPFRMERKEHKFCGKECADEFRRGKRAPTYRGARTIIGGYVIVRDAPEHRRQIGEHRKVMQDHLGRRLSSKEIVHHIDRDPTNNSIENLMLLPNMSAHIKLHAKEDGPTAYRHGKAPRTDNCKDCKRSFKKYKHQALGLCVACYLRQSRAKKGRR